jgi:hypothetical protein
MREIGLTGTATLIANRYPPSNLILRLDCSRILQLLTLVLLFSVF